MGGATTTRGVLAPLYLEGEGLLQYLSSLQFASKLVTERRKFQLGTTEVCTN